MGVPLETWRVRIGGWQGGRPAKKPSKDPSPCFDVMKRLPRGHLVLVTLCVTLGALSLSVRSADIALRLSHDIEKNPGPSSHCHGGGCPGDGILGHQRGVLHQTISLDPLERLFAGSTYTFGGAQRYINCLTTAIMAFIGREYPDVGGKGLLMVPHLPSPQEGITWDDLTKHFVAQRHGGLIQGSPHLQQNCDSNKRRLLDELVKKYRGEEGERLAVLPLLEWLGDKNVVNRDSTVVLGQKSTLELFQQHIEQELSTDPITEPVDRKIAITEKLAESVGLALNVQLIEQEAENLIVEYLGQQGLQSMSVMRNSLQSPPGLNRHQKAQKKKDVAMLLQILDDNASQQFFDPFKHVKHTLMVRHLNMSKKEHDIIFLKPHHKTVGHIEVKALTELRQSGEVANAINQLAGGLEEIKRAHGHLLDQEWSYLGVVCLPNLPQNLKPTLCSNLNICDYCADFVLVGDLHAPMKSLLDSSFGSEFRDEAVWRDQYKKLTSRILAMQHMNSSNVSTVKRITGREDEVVAAFTEGDYLPEPSTASADELKAWKEERHIGSPTSILFFTTDQLSLWREKKVIFLADYSTGKKQQNVAIRLSIKPRSLVKPW